MLTKRINGETRRFESTDEYKGLSIRDTDGIMSSAWEPTPDELQRLNAGATIYLHIMGTQHPPVLLEVGEIPK